MDDVLLALVKKIKWAIMRSEKGEVDFTAP